MPESTDIIANTREGWQEWREHEPLTAALEVAHVLVEFVVVLGQCYRLLIHMAVYGIVCEVRDRPQPWLTNGTVHFDRLAAGHLDGMDGRTDQLQRLTSAAFGVALYLQTGAFDHPNAEFWLFRLGAAYLVLDPVLGVAWRLYDD